MSVFENTSLFNDVAVQALRRYPFGADDEVRLLQLSENATYLVVNHETGSKDGVLRVGRPGYHTLEEYQGEMAWLRQINDYTPLIVANPLETSDGANIQIVKGSDGKDYYCVICGFSKARHPTRTTRRTPSVSTRRLARPPRICTARPKSGMAPNISSVAHGRTIPLSATTRFGVHGRRCRT